MRNALFAICDLPMTEMKSSEPSPGTRGQISPTGWRDLTFINIRSGCLFFLHIIISVPESLKPFFCLVIGAICAGACHRDESISVYDECHDHPNEKFFVRRFLVVEFIKMFTCLNWSCCFDDFYFTPRESLIGLKSC